MNPSNPAQPPSDAAYTAEGNPVTSDPAQQQAAQHHPAGGKPVEKRLPKSQSSGIDQAMSSSLGYGIHGATAGEEKFGHDESDVGRHRELEGDQMHAPGEGDVADAVNRKPGAGGTQPDLASDLDRKKQEQAAAREAIKDERKHGRVFDGGDLRAGVDT
ncbi:hypothetical protein F5X99DRAFT_220023 [Biscogniauxia marginata]|nr:hypothetical protein F5X99DRAFT_220023 [Biscogniauxia marginata]